MFIISIITYWFWLIYNANTHHLQFLKQLKYISAAIVSLNNLHSKWKKLRILLITKAIIKKKRQKYSLIWYISWITGRGCFLACLFYVVPQERRFVFVNVWARPVGKHVIAAWNISMTCVARLVVSIRNTITAVNTHCK